MADRLAIDGGKPARRATSPTWPVSGAREEELLLQVLHDGDWGELTGGMTREFARRFAAFQGAAHAVPVPNGTLALELALETLGVGHGDEVITIAYTFIATPGAILSMSANPVFVDIDPHTNTIDPARIETAITPSTKAIVPVHIGGLPADLDGVLEVANRHGIPVLEDACQAWGAAWKGTPVGAIGAMGAFSFQASKNLNAGEGGLVLTNDHALYERAWAIHDVGRRPDGAPYVPEMPGRDLRMTEWQAAILIAQLERLPDAMDRRDRSARTLTDGLADIPGLVPLTVDERVTRHAWHLYQVRYDPDAFGGRDREAFLRAINAEGVEATAGYRPLTAEPALLNAMRDRFGPPSVADLPPVPHAERAGERTVWLPQTLLLGDDEDMQDVVAACRKVQRAWG
jgi:dTDP-4-amino-4,6-dideoxygalactose transaminase